MFGRVCRINVKRSSCVVMNHLPRVLYFKGLQAEHGGMWGFSMFLIRGEENVCSSCSFCVEVCSYTNSVIVF